MPKSAPTTLAALLATVPAHRKAEVELLDRAIREAAPELEPHVANGMLAYGRYHYRYADGREGESFLVGIAARPAAISLHLQACVGKTYLPELHAARLGKVAVGRSCIRFKRLSDLTLPVALELIRDIARGRARPAGVQMDPV